MDQKSIENNRSKIYEELSYSPQPENYSSNIPWIVQQQIAATNGIHYIDRLGKLKDYPIFELPVLPVKRNENKLFLDIGCGWGRWLIGGHNKGYIPIGIDLRLEFCKVSRTVLSDLGKNGYTVVADLENIPFEQNTFDLIWSFSVIQHTHNNRLTNCLNHIGRILKPNGFTKLEFPNKNGFRNNIKNVKNSELVKDDYNSWCVRYYTPKEYKEIFDRFLESFSFTNHSFLGIGVLKEDLKYVSLKNKLISLTSLIGSSLTKVIPTLKNYSDSIYISAKKKSNADATENNAIRQFLNDHQVDPNNNLNIISLLRCPMHGSPIKLSADKTKAISLGNNIYYPIIDNIPIMIVSEAKELA